MVVVLAWARRVPCDHAKTGDDDGSISDGVPRGKRSGGVPGLLDSGAGTDPAIQRTVSGSGGRAGYSRGGPDVEAGRHHRISDGGPGPEILLLPRVPADSAPPSEKFPDGSHCDRRGR